MKAKRREIKTSEETIKPWLFQVPAYPGESFGHFLGRFRRANCLGSGQLSIMLGLKYTAVSYWETPSRRRFPAAQDLEALSQMTGVDVSQLCLMLIPKDAPLYLRTRLCAMCYTEAPFHKQIWQNANLSNCELHQRQLLCACPQCGCDFRLPSYWEIGQCEHCCLPFTEMSFAQHLAK
jgi:hypothetical protein